MTGDEMRVIRLEAELSQADLAAVLRLEGGAHSVQWMEAGYLEISGPVSLLLQLLDRGGLECITIGDDREARRPGLF